MFSRHRPRSSGGLQPPQHSPLQPAHGPLPIADSFPHRSGLTLLEIVLSLAIFFGAIAALSQLASSGTRATVVARLKTQATIRCETKLNEVLAGVEPMQARSSTPFPDDSRWTWSQVVTPSSHKELVQIDLTVSHRGNSRLASVDVTLRRWAREQAFFAQGATQEKQESEKAKARKQ